MSLVKKDTEPDEDRSTYFQRYYKENRDKINGKRKRRYHRDPDYRSGVLSASKDYRKKNRRFAKIRMPRFSRPLDVTAGDGGPVKLFSVGAFAQFMSRSVQAISHWERGGVLPPTPYRDERGHRYYTRAMMHVAKAVVGDRRRLFPVEGVFEEIKNGWSRVGVPIGAASMKAALKNTDSEMTEPSEDTMAG